MPARKRVLAGRKAAATRRRNLRGGGSMDVLKGIGGFIKDNKLLSTGLSMIPHPAGQVAGQVAGLFGLGRKRKTRRRLRGGSIMLPGIRSHAITL